jgi:acylphosphatase
VIRHVTIHGRVQGVGFRAWVEDMALMRGLKGWVRNRRDGSVEAVFSGPERAVEEMVEACRRGPGAARVERVDERAASEELLRLCRPGELFTVLPTT